MATVFKVTILQYFSCYRGPITHLCAKFHQNRSKNEEKIMSKTTALYVYDYSPIIGHRFKPKIFLLGHSYLQNSFQMLTSFAGYLADDELTCFTLAPLTHVNIGCPEGSRILVTSAIYGASPFGLCHGTGKDCTQEVNFYSLF